MKFKAILACSVLIAMFVVLPVFGGGQKDSGSAAPGQQYILRFNHVLTNTDPYHPAFLKWAEAVGAKTNGKLKVDVFHSAQLGVEEDIIEQIKQGSNVGQNTDSARLGNYVPGIAVMNAPYFVDNLDDVVKLNTLATVKGWKTELEQKFGIKILSFYWVQGFREVLSNKPIKKPADLAGLRIRTPGAPIWQESVRAIGAEPVAMAYGEMYPALQTKAIDGVELSYTAGFNGKFFEVTKYVSETKHILLINFEIISSKWFNSLPAEYQKVLEDECNKAGLEVSKSYLDVIDAKAKADLKVKGMTIIEASEIDMAAFKAAGEKAYQKLNLSAVRDSIYKELGKK
jgi:tripartite ATP-independent transporter DctP family solute receptor